jgi:hypothetical protein
MRAPLTMRADASTNTTETAEMDDTQSPIYTPGARLLFAMPYLTHEPIFAFRE